MGLDLFDLMFRLERRFGVRISLAQFKKMAGRRGIHDIEIGDLYELVRAQVPSTSVLDLETDGEDIWLIFQREISQALGVDEDEVTKDKLLNRDLGMN